MRVSQVTLIALSSVALSTFASPVAQFLPTSNDVVTDAPMKSTVLSTEAPVFTIQTSMPSDTAYPAPTTICSEGQDPGYPMTCEPDGIVTIQTSTPVEGTTVYPVPTYICSEGEEPGYPMTCEPDGTMTISQPSTTDVVATVYATPTSGPPHCTTRLPAYPAPTEIPYARRGESITDDGDDYDDYDDEDDADDADDADDGADDNEDDDDIEDGDDYGDLPFCDEEPTTSSQYSSSSTGSYVDPTPTVSSTSAVATPTSTGKISRIYPVRALISRCLAVDDDEPADGSPVTIATCDDGPKQDWELVPAQWYPPGDNVYIKLAGTNYCLDASFPVGSGTPMKIWTCYDGLVQQRWNYNINASLVLVDQGQCLDLTDGEIDSGTVVQTWECFQGNSNQKWFVIDKPE